MVATVSAMIADLDDSTTDNDALPSNGWRFSRRERAAYDYIKIVLISREAVSWNAVFGRLLIAGRRDYQSRSLMPISLSDLFIYACTATASSLGHTPLCRCAMAEACSSNKRKAACRAAMIEVGSA